MIAAAGQHPRRARHRRCWPAPPPLRPQDRLLAPPPPLPPTPFLAAPHAPWDQQPPPPPLPQLARRRLPPPPLPPCAPPPGRRHSPGPDGTPPSRRHSAPCHGRPPPRTQQVPQGTPAPPGVGGGGEGGALCGRGSPHKKAVNPCAWCPLQPNCQRVTQPPASHLLPLRGQQFGQLLHGHAGVGSQHLHSMQQSTPQPQAPAAASASPPWGAPTSPPALQLLHGAAARAAPTLALACISSNPPCNRWPGQTSPTSARHPTRLRTEKTNCAAMHRPCPSRHPPGCGCARRRPGRRSWASWGRRGPCAGAWGRGHPLGLGGGGGCGQAGEGRQLAAAEVHAAQRACPPVPIWRAAARQVRSRTAPPRPCTTPAAAACRQPGAPPLPPAARCRQPGAPPPTCGALPADRRPPPPTCGALRGFVRVDAQLGAQGAAVGRQLLDDYRPQGQAGQAQLPWDGQGGGQSGGQGVGGRSGLLAACCGAVWLQRAGGCGCCRAGCLVAVAAGVRRCARCCSCRGGRGRLRGARLL